MGWWRERYNGREKELVRCRRKSRGGEVSQSLRGSWCVGVGKREKEKEKEENNGRKRRGRRKTGKRSSRCWGDGTGFPQASRTSKECFTIIQLCSGNIESTPHPPASFPLHFSAPLLAPHSCQKPIHETFTGRFLLHDEIFVIL